MDTMILSNGIRAPVLGSPVPEPLPFAAMRSDLEREESMKKMEQNLKKMKRLIVERNHRRRRLLVWENDEARWWKRRRRSSMADWTPNIQLFFESMQKEYDHSEDEEEEEDTEEEEEDNIEEGIDLGNSEVEGHKEVLEEINFISAGIPTNQQTPKVLSGDDVVSVYRVEDDGGDGVDVDIDYNTNGERGSSDQPHAPLPPPKPPELISMKKTEASRTTPVVTTAGRWKKQTGEVELIEMMGGVWRTSTYSLPPKPHDCYSCSATGEMTVEAGQPEMQKSEVAAPFICNGSCATVYGKEERTKVQLGKRIGKFFDLMGQAQSEFNEGCWYAEINCLLKLMDQAQECQELLIGTNSRLGPQPHLCFEIGASNSTIFLREPLGPTQTNFLKKLNLNYYEKESECHLKGKCLPGALQKHFSSPCLNNFQTHSCGPPVLLLQQSNNNMVGLFIKDGDGGPVLCDRVTFPNASNNSIVYIGEDVANSHGIGANLMGGEEISGMGYAWVVLDMNLGSLACMYEYHHMPLQFGMLNGRAELPRAGLTNSNECIIVKSTSAIFAIMVWYREIQTSFFDEFHLKWDELYAPTAPPFNVREVELEPYSDGLEGFSLVPA